MTSSVNSRAATLMPYLSGIGDTSIEPGQISEALAPLGDVPPFLRSLLVADGTVTMALEAYFLEPIRIVTLTQGPVRSQLDIPSLGISAGADGYFREVELRGERTDLCYGHATSMLNKAAIREELFHQLVDEHIGIGVILRNAAKGSYREVLSVNSGGLFTDALVHRTYLVSLNGVPAILITEEFPASVYTG